MKPRKINLLKLADDILFVLVIIVLALLVMGWDVLLRISPFWPAIERWLDN